MIVFRIGFIVFVLITNEVVQSEAIMTGDKIDAARGSFAGFGINIGAAADSLGE